MTGFSRRHLFGAAGGAVVLSGIAPLPALARTPSGRQRRVGVFNGRSIAYTAGLDEIVVVDAQGAPFARFVCTSYVRDDIERRDRPVLFAFNGGPSSSSATLHMLALGPKRIELEQDPKAPALSPARLVENPETVLDVADIVLIDPPETGFTRVLSESGRKDAYSVEGDARAVSDFIRAWIKANGRETSPKYVLGESYGTIRAAVMAGQLAQDMPLDGVFLFGQAINMIETSQRVDNMIAYATNLPALAAIAVYHGKVDKGPRAMNRFIDDVYAWGMTDYLAALVQGQSLAQPRRRAVAAELERLTGIDADFYFDGDLTISKVAFAGMLLADRGQRLGVYDARYVGPAPTQGRRPQDPFEAKVSAGVLPMMQRYLRTELAPERDAADYRPLAPGADAWTYDPTGGAGGPFNEYDYPARLVPAFNANPRFRLMIGTGIYDLTTTVGPALYLAAQSDYPVERVIQRRYEGGHMAYTNRPALTAFTRDIRSFVTGTAFVDF
ncbi:S10 family peptidase [Brevundimonas sp. SORGH_AS_0993]|uniref:S10 family peptidase n=1 Tax=Brevundimonas sp. SORGH_AS_0993 TaxID=3041794 RepID=UPI002783A76A|nr:hypothetical protein [Brevundimonas sp. SORGH_AS_0993]MDQ1155516.1 carboxypeptidase C (cathepsin A) [Brevundimonas sp. SORGH_AS_0993]